MRTADSNPSKPGHRETAVGWVSETSWEDGASSTAGYQAFIGLGGPRLIQVTGALPEGPREDRIAIQVSPATARQWWAGFLRRHGRNRASPTNGYQAFKKLGGPRLIPITRAPVGGPEERSDSNPSKPGTARSSGRVSEKS